MANLYNKFYITKKRYSFEAFLSCIDDLLTTFEVQSLNSIPHHIKCSRLYHSLNVAYYAYCICRYFELDYRSAARAGLLHDLFYYKHEQSRHLSTHPRVALLNAQKITVLNKIEKDCIVKHMWPVTSIPPKYKESMIVCLADKYAAVVEISEQVWDVVIKKYSKFKSYMTTF